MAAMEERGIGLLYGRWLIEGAPRVLLIDTSTGYRWLDEWKGDLWSAAGIPSPAGDSETNEAIVFGYLVAWFLGEVSGRCSVSVGGNGRRADEASSLPKSNPGQSSLISTNGLLVLPSL
jgi:Glycogen synthase